jgi:hypothetical protein
MRLLWVVLLTIATLIGLPRLADNFRENPANGTPSGNDAANAARDGKPTAAAARNLPGGADAGIAAKPSSTRVVPVSLKPAELAPAGVSQVSALPASDDELISAIQRELMRLGYYDGPITIRWGKAVRAAARNFAREGGSRVRHPLPTIKLLLALQATKSEGSRVAGRERPTSDLTSAEPAHPAQVPNTVALRPDASQVPLRSDGYLPPWHENARTARDHLARSDGISASPVERTATDKASDAGDRHAGVSRSLRHRRHRTARAGRARRTYSSYREATVWTRRRFFWSDL